MNASVHTSSDSTDCPYCGSYEVEALDHGFDVYRCLACDAHFEESDDETMPPPPRTERRKMKHNKYKEDGEWI